ncbi:MAG TPA: hypothetical protein VHE37_08750 [Nevskiaceae bacterium]|nr:hypothetical protein [Nevskiaceae bacterium]
MVPANKLPNMRRRVNRARNFPYNTCPASRHLHAMAEALATRGEYSMLTEEPDRCAGTMLSVLESLFKARTELAMLKRPK